MSLSEQLRLRLGHSQRPELVSRYEEHLIQSLGLGETLADKLSQLEQSPLTDPVWRDLLSLILVPKTAFFRHAEQLEGVRRHLEGAHGLRVWSVGCASGEEAYTLGLLLGVRAVEVVGTDVGAAGLDVARGGVYRRHDLSEVPFEHQEALAPDLDGAVRVSAALRLQVHFERVNIAEPSTYPRPRCGEGWDLIFCRNVLIYFDAEAKLVALANLGRQLTPKGLLVLSPAEHAPAAGALRLVKINEGVFAYSRPGSGSSGSGSSPSRGTAQPMAPVAVGAKDSMIDRGESAAEASARAPAPAPVRAPALVPLEEAERFEAAGDVRAAVTWLERASVLADLDPALHWRIGRAYRRLGHPTQAGQSLRRVLLLDSERWPAAFQLAGILFEQGAFAAAEREYQRTRRILRGDAREDPFYRGEVDASCRRRITECRIRLSVQ